MSSLLSRLQQPEASEVAALWDALLIARRDCEAMASRGVRVARDVSRDWQETVSDLIDRVVAQDGEICGLKQQVSRGAGSRGTGSTGRATGWQEGIEWQPAWRSAPGPGVALGDGGREAFDAQFCDMLPPFTHMRCLRRTSAAAAARCRCAGTCQWRRGGAALASGAPEAPA